MGNDRRMRACLFTDASVVRVTYRLVEGGEGTVRGDGAAGQALVVNAVFQVSLCQWRYMIRNLHITLIKFGLQSGQGSGYLPVGGIRVNQAVKDTWVIRNGSRAKLSRH